MSKGGTGANQFTSNSVIMSGSSTTSALTTRALKNLTAKGNLGWTSSSVDNTVVTTNTMAYWDGRYNSTSSNLTYCVKGAFGNLAIKDSLAASDIPSLAASKITSGTFDVARIPNLSWNKITSDKPTTLSGYGITDAKIASGIITLGSNTITPVTSVNGHTGNSVTVTVADLGLSNAMHFIGKATVAITNGSTANPTISGYDFTNKKAAGDVIIDKDTDYEYVWTTEGKWERLGGNSSYKVTQTAVTKPSAATNKWVSAIGQDANGVIDVSYTTLDTSGTWSGLAGKLTNLTTTDKASSTDTWRYIWFSYNDLVTGRPAYSDQLVYQTSTNTLKINGGTITATQYSGNAATATLAAKATADGSGNNIVDTYLTKATYNTGAKGDIIYWSAANTPAHLTNTSSTTKNFLSITSQVPAWTTLSKSDVGLGNVTNDAQVKASLGTAKGDLLYWSASATPARLGIGTNGYFLTVSSGVPAWSALPTASTSAAGIVQLSSATNSTSTTLAATASAVKAAYDLANGKTSNTGTVTSITISATSPVAVSASGAITTSGTRTISLADAYGDTKNPYGTKTANYVLAGPSSGNAAAPSFRALVAADIPNLAAGKITSGTFDAARIPSLSTDKLTSGTLPVGRGGTGQTSIANIQAGKDGDGNTISSTYLKLSGGTLTGRLTTDKAINAAITGTHTAAVTSSPYKPVKWTFNTGSAPSDGDIFTIKTPGAGHDYGVFISVDNGATYQPVVRFNKNRLTTHYDAGTYLTVIYSSSAVTNSVFPADGATSRSNITGSWQIINDYDSGNDVYQLYSASGNGRPVETAANGGLGLHGYTLQMMTANQAWSSIACTSGSTAANSGTTTTKVAATCNFLLGSPILYMSNNSYVAPGGTGNVNGYTATSMNLKYSTSGSYSLAVQKPVYLVGTINSDKATFKLVSSNWWTQTLPTSKDGKIYIMLGLAYDANSIYLATDHPIFYHNGTCVTMYGASASEVIVSTTQPSTTDGYKWWINPSAAASSLTSAAPIDVIRQFNVAIAANQWGSADSNGYHTCRLSSSSIQANDIILSIASTSATYTGNFTWTTANGYIDLKTTNAVATTLKIVVARTNQSADLTFTSIAAV